MHIVVAALYAAIMWLALVAFLVYAEGPAVEVFACGPLVFSAIIVLLYAIELLVALSRICINRAVDEIREWRSIMRAR